MALTAQNIFDRALGRSGLNNANLVSVNDVLSNISTYQRKVFLLGARLNPEYFGKTADTATRAAITDSWDLSTTPGDVAAVTKATVKTITGTVSGVSVGTTVNLVVSRFQDYHVSPRAYIRGRKVYQVGTELGTNGSNLVTALTLDYSELPTAVASLATTLRLPDEWAHLVEIPLARLFALRDKREEEAQFLDAEYNENLKLFTDAVFVLDHGATRPLLSVPAIPVQAQGSGQG